LPNVQTQRPRASNVQNSTETQSQGSVQPVYSLLVVRGLVVSWRQCFGKGKVAAANASSNGSPSGPSTASALEYPL